MSRLIDALELKRSISVSAVIEDGKHIFDIIDEQPTIEPERKTGQWIGYNADDPNWQRDDGTPVFLMCSACQAFVINNGAANWNYCPGCGSYNGGEQDEVG